MPLVRWAFLLFAACSVANAQQKDLSARFTDLVKATQLDARGNPAFHLKIDAQLYDLAGEAADKGTIEEWWLSPDEFRIELNSTSLHIVIATGVEDGPATAFTRERYLLDRLLSETVHPLSTERIAVQSEASHSFGNVNLSCLEFLSDLGFGVPGPPTLACTSASTGNLLAKLQQPELVARDSVGKFHDTQVSLSTKILYNGIPAIQGKVTALQTISPGQPDLPALHPREQNPQPAPLAADRLPAGVTAGKPISRPQPDYPIIAKETRTHGTVLLHGIISREGNLRDIVVIVSPDESLASAALAAVRHWTYQPYLLNGQPVEVDTLIRVNFNINGRP